MQSTKIYVLSGFLGAGKTSVVQHLLRSMPDMQGTVVIVNEFGQLGIDGQLLEKPGLSLYQLVNGCICCLLEDDLLATMGLVLETQKPQRILLEASGVADTANLRRSLCESILQDKAHIAKVVTVLDARMWERRAALGKLFHSQLAQADQILLNKIDLLTSDKTATIKKAVQTNFPQAQVITTVKGETPTALFWSEATKSFTPAPFLAAFSQILEIGFVSCHLQSTNPIDRDAFTAFWRMPPTGLLRAKGQVLFADGSRHFFDWVDGQFDWHAPLDSIEGNYLILIGNGLDADMAQKRLDSLLLR